MASLDIRAVRAGKNGLTGNSYFVDVTPLLVKGFSLLNLDQVEQQQLVSTNIKVNSVAGFPLNFNIRLKVYQLSF